MPLPDSVRSRRVSPLVVGVILLLFAGSISLAIFSLKLIEVEEVFIDWRFTLSANSPSGSQTQQIVWIWTDELEKYYRIGSTINVTASQYSPPEPCTSNFSLMLTSAVIKTGGFRMLSVNPSLPGNLVTTSGIISMNIRAPYYPFTGELHITVSGSAQCNAM